MKKVLLVLAVLISHVSYGQEFKKLFLGKDWNTYKGLHLKYKVGTIGGMNYSFYSDKPTKIYQNGVYHRTDKYSFVTDTNAIKGRDFLVVNTSPLSFDFRKALFELNDGKETLYFIYDSQYDFEFPFEVSGFNYTVDYLSKDIKRTVDDFTDEITLRTPLMNDISITKSIEKGSSKPTYYLSLRTRGSTLNYGGKGVIILFKDGTKWIKSEQKIDVDIVSGSGWGYSAFITLNEQDLNLFSTKEISKFKLYIYDNHAPDDTDKFVYYTQAIVKSK